MFLLGHLLTPWYFVLRVLGLYNFTQLRFKEGKKKSNELSVSKAVSLVDKGTIKLHTVYSKDVYHKLLSYNCL